jgi:ankyrin repeat protein
VTNVNNTDKNGRTALHFACSAGNAKSVTAVLAYPGVARDIRTSGGNSPLMLAVSSGDIFSVVACLNAGCNPFLENSLRETAKVLAKQFPNRRGQEFEKYIDQAME